MYYIQGETFLESTILSFPVCLSVWCLSFLIHVGILKHFSSMRSHCKPSKKTPFLGRCQVNRTGSLSGIGAISQKQMLGKHATFQVEYNGQKHHFYIFGILVGLQDRLCSLYPILQGLPIRWVWSQKATWAWSCQNVSDVVLCRSSYNSMVPALCLVENDGNFILKRMIENNWCTELQLGELTQLRLEIVGVLQWTRIMWIHSQSLKYQ